VIDHWPDFCLESKAMQSSQGNDHGLFKTVIDSSVEEIDLLSHWARTTAEENGFSSTGIFKLDLVLSEVVTNIIQYAFNDLRMHKILIELRFSDQVVQATIQDTGIPFDPTNIPEIMLANCLEEAQIGGLGVHLVRSYCDRFSYQRLNDTNVLTLVINDRN
jgi:anti-sigma regulatory factor (Ser/Thr protein kinase)